MLVSKGVVWVSLVAWEEEKQLGRRSGGVLVMRSTVRVGEKQLCWRSGEVLVIKGAVRVSLEVPVV